MTLALTEVEMESPEPEVLAAHWGKIIGIAVSTGKIGEPELELPNASFRFVKGASRHHERADVSGWPMSRRCAMPPRPRAMQVSGDSFDLGGVTFRLVA